MTTQCLHPTCRCLLLLMLFADRALSGRVSPFLLTFPTLPPLSRRSHASPPQKSHPHPRSVCMLTPLVSFRVLSILSQTVTGVVSTWLHFLKCATSGSSGKQDGAGSRDGMFPLARAECSPSGRREQGAVVGSFEPVLVPEVEQTPWCPPHLSAGRKSSSSASGQVSWQPLPPHPHLLPAQGMPPFCKSVHAGIPPCHLRAPSATSLEVFSPLPPSAGSWLLVPTEKGLAARWGGHTLL